MSTLAVRLSPRLQLARRRLAPVFPIAAITAVFALLPFSTCVVKLLVERPCPGCGVTRATLHLLRGRIDDSLRMHPVVLPGALGMALAVVLALTLPDEHPVWPRFVRIAMTVLALALFSTWLLRLAGVLSPV